MNTQKLTQKSLEAIQSANGLAIENQNQQIEQVHLLSALLGQEGGLIPQLFEKIGVSVDNVQIQLKNAIDNLPAVTGSGRKADEVYVSQDVDRGLREAEKRGYSHERRLCISGTSDAWLVRRNGKRFEKGFTAVFCQKRHSWKS